MDLIYTNTNREEIGIIKDYIFDIAYGSSENNFILKVPRTGNMIEDGAFLYEEEIENGLPVGTEYGGIVDSITTDTVNNEITYHGRTWHGILAGQIIEPNKGYDFFTADGDVNEIFQILINKLNISDMFFVSQEASGLIINQFQFPRYIDAYTGIRKMLASVNGKLKLRYNSIVKKVEISAVIISNYADDEEWDNDLFSFKAKVNYRPVNHLICLGQGELADRAVIHLFLDRDNALMRYANTDNPLEADDYILDKSQQSIFGKDEVSEVYDYPSAEVVTNYIVLNAKPDNWETACDQYFYMAATADGNINYSNVAWEEYNYAVLLAKPEDWDYAFSNYYQIVDDRYIAVTTVPADRYAELTVVPSDWANNYSGYFKNVGGQFVPVEGEERYNLLENAPEKWEENYYDYYQIVGGKYVPVESEEGEYDLLTEQPADWSTNYGNYYDANGESVTTTTVYPLTTSEPPGWAKEFAQYFTTDGLGNYSPVRGESKMTYHLQSQQPSDWKEKYSDYYYKEGKKYKPIPSAAKDTWPTITEEPNKWKSTYQNYYVISWDGVQKNYTSVEADTKNEYQLQKSSKAPSDWGTNYNNYYTLNSKGKYEKVKGVKKGSKTVAPKWTKNKYYTLYQSSKVPNFTKVLNSSYGKKLAYKTVKDNPPKWAINTYYTGESESSIAPAWEKNKYYRSETPAPTWEPGKYYTPKTSFAPTWEPNKYYEYDNIYAPNFGSGFYDHITEEGPAWQPNTYYYEHQWRKAPEWEQGAFYRMAYDYYKALVENGIALLQKYIDADEIDMTNQLYKDYDIGDIVGANDNVTGISVWQPITKKIVTIDRGITSFSYEIGKEEF